MKRKIEDGLGGVDSASSVHQQVLQTQENSKQRIANNFTNSTDSKIKYTVELLGMQGISPAEIINAVKDVKKLEKAGLTATDALRNAGTIRDIKNEVKKMIENNSPDIEFFAQGSEGIIYKMKVTIENTVHTFIAMKKRYDNNVKHESKMLAQANNLVVDSDRKGESSPNTRAKVPNYLWPIKAKDLENQSKEAEYLVMEYIDGKTLYTLQLEATIKRMMKKVETTAMYSLEELKNEQFEIFKKSRISEGIEKIKGEVNRAKGNLSSAETAYKTLPEPMREKAIAKAKSEYESEINKKKEEIKTEYSLRWPAFKAKKEEYLSNIQQQYLQLKEIFEEYRNTLLRKQIDFRDDNHSYSQYTTIRDTYLSVMRDCKPILKSSPRRFPDVYNSSTDKQWQTTMTSEFLRFMQEENLPIFSAEERKKIASRITNTLDIFHKHHFYHRDLGENPRNLMFKRENGEYIPYIIDFGLATEDVRYQEGPEAKYDPLHTSRTSVTETYYAKDSAILSFITSGEEA